ncbi:MAG: cell division protein FtsI [Aquabacterium sp.]|uniref:cell division protein FtsI n=1 Tax=Aquabacterium sp. TaxID=1872578 RepID=UPI003BE6B45A
MWNLSRAHLCGWIILSPAGLLGCSIVTPAPLIELAKATGAAASTMVSVTPNEPVNVVQNVAVSPKSVCIEYNPVCPVVDILPALQQGLTKNGISSRVYEPGTHFGYCRYWVKYSASMDWGTPLMSDQPQSYLTAARLTLASDAGIVLAYAEYRLGGLMQPGKWASVYQKMEPVVRSLVSQGGQQLAVK